MDTTELTTAAERLWYVVGAVGMLLGALVMLAKLRGSSKDGEPHHVAHLFVVLAAATAYLTMALDQGKVLVGDPATGLRPLYYARYVDWSFTTPALLFALSATAMGSASRRPALVAGLLLSDVFMILTGLFASLTAHTASKWTWYGVSCAFFLAVLVLLWGEVRAEAERQPGPDVARVWRGNATLLSALWLAYPIVWILGRTGLRAVAGSTEAGLYAVLDLAAKVGYGLFTLGRLPRLEPHARHYAPVVETLPVLGPGPDGADGRAVTRAGGRTLSAAPPSPNAIA